MRKFKFTSIGMLVFVLAVALAGCGDADRNANAGSPGDPLTGPTVTAVTPPDLSASVCPGSAVITATFSKAMNPATINSPATTFTLSLNGANVPGQVSYNSATQIATFTSAAPLMPSVSYTATITTGAQDQFGSGLTTSKVWTFTTSVACAPPSGVALGAACGFGILGGSTVTNTGATSITALTGTADLGVSPGSAVTGFADPPANIYVGPGTHTAGPGLVSGTIHLMDPTAALAQLASTAAYNDLAGRSAPAPATVAGDLGGQTLAPGIYKSTSTLGITGTLTLNGGGDANAVWIFQIASGLTTAPSSSIVLAGGAQSRNIFWQVGSSATLGTSSTFNGSILALTSVTVTTGATLNGRALAQNGAVTLDTNMVTAPSCP